MSCCFKWLQSSVAQSNMREGGMFHLWTIIISMATGRSFWFRWNEQVSSTLQSNNHLQITFGPTDTHRHACTHKDVCNACTFSYDHLCDSAVQYVSLWGGFWFHKEPNDLLVALSLLHSCLFFLCANLLSQFDGKSEHLPLNVTY